MACEAGLGGGLGLASSLWAQAGLKLGSGWARAGLMLGTGPTQAQPCAKNSPPGPISLSSPTWDKLDPPSV